MVTAFDVIKRKAEIMVDPGKFVNEHLEKLNSLDLTCRFKEGDIVRRKQGRGSFTYPHEGMPAKVVRVYNDLEQVSRENPFCDMACSIVNDLGDVDIFLFDSKDFELFE